MSDVMEVREPSIGQNIKTIESITGDVFEYDGKDFIGDIHPEADATKFEIIEVNPMIVANLYKCELNNPYHMIVNSITPLDKSYVPENLYKPNVRFATDDDVEKNYMEYVAGISLEKLFQAALEDGIRLIAVSGYRQYKRQEVLYNSAIANMGRNQRTTASAGTSEHQTGLAMDLNQLNVSFGETKEGKWVARNAHKFGYIVRYPKDKEDITGITYEPWHIRYVGMELAKVCYEQNLTLEELIRCC